MTTPMSSDRQPYGLAFNALPRNRLWATPAGVVPNIWHFSVRHVPFPPSSSCVFLVNPALGLPHFEGPLPAGAETAPLAIRAMFVALRLIKAFGTGLGRGAAGPGKPWEWKTDDADMAKAVGDCLRSLGVGEGLDIVGVLAEGEGKVAEEKWQKLFGQLKEKVEADGGN